MITKEQLFILQTLANKTRLEIIYILKNEKSISVSELANKLKIEQTRLSHALKCLKNCGIVNSEIKGKYRKYSLNSKFSDKLFNLLDEHLKIYKKQILGCEIIKKENENYK